MVAPTSFFADYGCHVRILEEAQILQKLGHSVTIATYHNGGPVDGQTWRIDFEETFGELVPLAAAQAHGPSRRGLGEVEGRLGGHGFGGPGGGGSEFEARVHARWRDGQGNG